MEHNRSGQHLNNFVVGKLQCLDENRQFQFLHPITEYACEVFHNGLPQYLVDDLERLQKRALQTIYPSLTYRDSLIGSNLPTLYDRRDGLTKCLFNEISSNANHKLYNLLTQTELVYRKLEE